VKHGQGAGAHGRAHAGHQGHGGLCKPYAAEKLVKALRQEVGIPIHFHTHDTSGINAASVLKAADAGVHVADGAIASMSGRPASPI
jgi:pyruvate carboxylase